MITTRPGAWATAFGAVGDALQGFRDVPRPYVVVLVVSALSEFIMLPYSLDPQAEASPVGSFIVLGFMLISMFLLTSPYIALVRYFLYADMSAGFEPRGPVLRVFGWMLALSFGAGLIFGGAMLVAAVIAMAVQTKTAAQAAVAAVSGLALVGLLWASLRLTTFFVALALDEPVSLRARFAETGGRVWFILRTLLASCVVLIPYFLAMIAIQFGIFGAESFAAETIPPPSLGQRLLDALLTGVLGAAYFAYVAALYVRLFRAVPAA